MKGSSYEEIFTKSTCKPKHIAALLTLYMSSIFSLTSLIHLKTKAYTLRGHLRKLCILHECDMTHNTLWVIPNLFTLFMHVFVYIYILLSNAAMTHEGNTAVGLLPEQQHRSNEFFNAITSARLRA